MCLQRGLLQRKVCDRLAYCQSGRSVQQGIVQWRERLVSPCKAVLYPCYFVSVAACSLDGHRHMPVGIIALSAVPRRD